MVIKIMFIRIHVQFCIRNANSGHNESAFFFNAPPVELFPSEGSREVFFILIDVLKRKPRLFWLIFKLIFSP